MANKIINKAFSAFEVRNTFLDYFKSSGHKFIPATSVLGGSGHGTYFTNAGMNQFRSVFEAENLPETHPLYNVRKATNSQRCIRMNDLCDVGVDGYHHTLFEMLGTWSFGLENSNRFRGKKEAILSAWKLLTKEYGIDESRLMVTYFGGEKSLGIPTDDETREVWLQLGLSPDKIIPAGMDSNFWTMGELGGPCGPCTEIHFQTNSSGKFKPWPDLLELWNLVFISYCRDSNGKNHELPRCHIDTGLGLERLVSVIGQKHSNYGNDIFMTIFEEIRKIYKLPEYADQYDSVEDVNFAYRVIADHIRMASVAIADGVLPSNRDLGHKVRSVLTRAFGQLASLNESFLYEIEVTFPQLVDCVIEKSPVGSFYPEFNQKLHTINSVVRDEAVRFKNAWRIGKETFQTTMARHNISHLNKVLCTDIAVELLEYPSMSLELLISLAKFYGLEIDVEKVRIARSCSNPVKKSHSRTGMDSKLAPDDAVIELRSQNTSPTCDKHQYNYCRLDKFSYYFPPCQSEIVSVHSTGNSKKCWICFDRTNLHPSNLGGQATDFGCVKVGDSTYQIDMVQQVGSTSGGDSFILHRVLAPESAFKVGDNVEVSVDGDRRLALMRAHTACHLTMAAVRAVGLKRNLRKPLVVMQAGSNVESDRFTIDIQTPLPLTKADFISNVQLELNGHIESNSDTCVETSVVSIEEAMKNEDIVHLPNEEYPPLVRVVQIGGKLSQELCCGTHVTNTGDIGSAVIMNASGGKQGVKRFTVFTGKRAIEALAEGKAALQSANQLKLDLQSFDSNFDQLNQIIKGLACVRKSLDSKNLPRVVRDELIKDLEFLSKSTLSAVCQSIKTAFSSSCRNSVQIVPLAWKGLRTETTKSIIIAAGKSFNSKPTGFIFYDVESERLMCSLPLDRLANWQEIAKQFDLRADATKDSQWFFMDGSCSKEDLPKLKDAIVSQFVDC